MRQRRFSVLVAVILLLLTGCGGQRGGDNAGSAAQPTSCEVTADARLSIATGNTTGVYYTVGGAYAEAISQQTGGKLKATAPETSASVQNIQQLVGRNASDRALARRHRRRRRQRHRIVYLEAA